MVNEKKIALMIRTQVQLKTYAKTYKNLCDKYENSKDIEGQLKYVQYRNMLAQIKNMITESENILTELRNGKNEELSEKIPDNNVEKLA